MTTESCWMTTPVGTIRLDFDSDNGVSAIDFENDDAPRTGRNAAATSASVTGGVGQKLQTALAAYFAGVEALPDGVPLAPAGTAFQRRVWAALQQIPWGETRTYGEIAAAIGAPSAARAVGGACARNPIAIIVPCHRVVGSNGKLTGYAGGIERKRWLLAHEQRPGQTLALS